MVNIVKAICAREGLDYQNSIPLSGGDINDAYLITTNNKSYFLKVNDALAYPDMLRKEAEGLDALHRQSILKVPEVLAAGDYNGKQYLLLEWLQKAQPSAHFWETFGQGMAQLHQVTSWCFGWTSSNYIGSLIQANDERKTWVQFYATLRIMPLAERLFNESLLSKADLHAAEKLCARLGEIFPEELPALLHGDLWSGNFMAINNDKIVGHSVPAIYDPAVYFGHRELDLGMTLLFGGFDNRFYAAYDSYFPLEPGWKERVSLTQLYPLLVHAILFGGGYISQCRTILHKWGG